MHTGLGIRSRVKLRLSCRLCPFLRLYAPKTRGPSSVFIFAVSCIHAQSAPVMLSVLSFALTRRIIRDSPPESSHGAFTTSTTLLDYGRGGSGTTLRKHFTCNGSARFVSKTNYPVTPPGLRRTCPKTPRRDEEFEREGMVP